MVVRVKNPRFEHTDRKNPQWPNWVKTAPQQINGECQASVRKQTVPKELFNLLNVG